MAVVKVSDSNGVKELQCFDTLDNVPYLEDQTLVEEVEDDDSVDF